MSGGLALVVSGTGRYYSLLVQWWHALAVGRSVSEDTVRGQVLLVRAAALELSPGVVLLAGESAGRTAPAGAAVF